MQSSWSRLVATLRRWLGYDPVDTERWREASKPAGPYRRAAAVSAGDDRTGTLAPDAHLAFDVFRDGVLQQSVLVARDQHVIQLGRHQGCDVRIDHPAISRMHTVVNVLDATGLYTRLLPGERSGVLEIIDLGSATGTRVNGELIDRGGLQLGDTIEIGTVQVELTRRYGKPGIYRPAPRTPLPPVVE